MTSELAGGFSCPPALGTLLQFAERGEVFSGDAYAWRCRLFGVARQQDVPVAPFAALGDGLAPGSSYWLCADPVHLQLHRDSFVMGSVAEAMDTEHAAAFIESLNQHFADDGMSFVAPHAGRWYLKLAQRPAISTTPLHEVIGRNIHHLLPAGNDALVWHRRLNEIQMLLHGHPVNIDLEQQGRMPFNSLWLWGGGVLPEPAGGGSLAVMADDAFTRGLSLAMGGKAHPLPFSTEDWLAAGLEGQSTLIVVDHLQAASLQEAPEKWGEALRRQERHWFSPLLQGLREGKIGRLELHLAGMHSVRTYHLTRQSLLKFWRRPRQLGAYLG